MNNTIKGMVLATLALGGVLVGGAADSVNLWPVYYYEGAKDGGSFNACLGIAGGSWQEKSRCSWLFPLWYEDDDSFYSLAYSAGAKDGHSWWTVPALLAWGDTRETGTHCRSEGSFLLETFGWYAWRDVSRDYASYWLFPLVWYDTDGSWLTPLGGRFNCAGVTNTVITPLVGITTGDSTGGWFFPIWSQYKSADFDRRVALLDAPTLPESIKVESRIVGQGATAERRYSAEKFISGDEMTVLLGDIHHRVLGFDVSRGVGATNVYSLCEIYARGNRLVSGYRSRRVITFDLVTRRKLSDVESVESGLLEWLGVYWYDYGRDCTSGAETTRHRVLWKLWDWQEDEKGEISLDVFPGFCYASRPDGYTKTAFWWRLFRYENEPTVGTSIDFLFIPIWR